MPPNERKLFDPESGEMIIFRERSLHDWGRKVDIIRRVATNDEIAEFAGKLTNVIDRIDHQPIDLENN